MATVHLIANFCSGGEHAIGKIIMDWAATYSTAANAPDTAL